MVSLGKRGRNGARFLTSRAISVRQRPEPRTDKKKASFSGLPSLSTASGYYGTEHDTIEETMAED